MFQFEFFFFSIGWGGDIELRSSPMLGKCAATESDPSPRFFCLGFTSLTADPLWIQKGLISWISILRNVCVWPKRIEKKLWIITKGNVNWFKMKGAENMNLITSRFTLSRAVWGNRQKPGLSHEELVWVTALPTGDCSPRMTSGEEQQRKPAHSVSSHVILSPTVQL